ncbi:MAG TPA: glycosyltransferase family 1 protein [Azospirillaceae bacterium]|nr:glycosyltransferase family 1 protein [Azospirillaceae bacterium]
MSPPPRADGNASAVTPSRLLVCFSHLRWNFVYQRPQHLLSRAARTYRVYFVEEPVFEPDVAPRLDLSRQPCGVVVCTPVLPDGPGGEECEAAQRSLVDDLLAGHADVPLVVWYYTPMALTVSDHLAPDVCVYDCMDELSAFRGAPPRLTLQERRLFDRADLVFTGGRSLYEAKRGRHHSVHAFPSSIDAAHFARARAGAVDPSDQAAVPRPRLGFFGVVDERMDVDMVGHMADLRPDWQFVMIGPVVKIDPGILPRRPNIHWLGGKRYEELPDYLAGWDVGLMPFALNESTRFISPTKTPEFLAAGVPVVSTRITDVVRPYGEAGLVEIASDPEDAVRKAAHLLQRPKGSWLERVDRFLGTMSWDRTWSEMDALVQDAMAQGGQRSERTRATSAVVASKSKGAARV